jgi:hypothetical protein
MVGSSSSGAAHGVDLVWAADPCNLVGVVVLPAVAVAGGGAWVDWQLGRG